MNLCEMKFPKVKEIELVNRCYPENYIYPEEWYSYQYRFMKRYFLNTLSGWSILQYFDEDVKGKVAIYSVIDFADILIQDMKRYDDNIYLSDKDALKFEKGYKNYSVLNQEQLVSFYYEGLIKKIIVCNFFHANEIMQELLDLGIDLNDLVTITAILTEAY